jgi:hypothetical protein
LIFVLGQSMVDAAHVPTELEKVQLAKAQADLEIAHDDRALKKIEVEEAKSRWRYISAVIANPAFLAAVVTAAITWSISATADKSARLQREAEDSRATLQRAAEDKRASQQLEAEDKRARLQRDADDNRARLQRAEEHLRFEEDKDKSILLGIISPADPSTIASKLKLFLATNLISDPTGAFRKTEQKLDDQLREEILLNIVRASHDYPMNFPLRQSAEFYSGLVSPISLHDLKNLIEQGYSRELLFWLLIDSVALTVGNKGTVGFQFNPPYDYGCAKIDPRNRCFREWVEIATVTGLSAEDRPEGTNGNRSTIYSRLCFDPVRGSQGRNSMELATPGRLEYILARYVDPGLSSLSPKCGSSNWTSKETDSLEYKLGPLTFKFNMRSPYRVFLFLGLLLRQQAGGPDFAEISDFIRPEEVIPVLSTVQEDKRFLNVVMNDPATRCFVETSFLDDQYCIPEEGSANSNRIVGLLEQLLILKQREHY